MARRMVRRRKGLKMKTGAYLRVQRDGKWINADIADMTELEIRDFIKPDRALLWVIFLVKWIREHVMFDEDAG